MMNILEMHYHALILVEILDHISASTSSYFGPDISDLQMQMNHVCSLFYYLIWGQNLIQHTDYVSFVMVLKTGKCPAYIDLEDCLLSTCKQKHSPTANS